MRELTQTNLVPGNCWQTAVACVVDADPAEMPDQVQIEAAGGRYGNALSSYLEKHHDGLMYASLQDYQWAGVNPPDGLYLWEGTTVRTPATGIEHVVVARGREMVWDTHPSRAGLVEVKRWGIIVKAPRHIIEWKERLRADPENALGRELSCACPRCR